MKPLRILMVLALLIFPLLAWAQENPPQPPPPPDPDSGPVIVAQGPGPQTRGFAIRTGGPVNAMYMNPEPGMGLGAWWKNSEVVSKIQLSDDQVKKISQTYLDHKLKLIDLQADVQKQELRLQPLMDADHPDAGQVGAQIDAISAARRKLEKENAMMMLAIRGELTVDQWKKLKTLQTGMEENHVVIWRNGHGSFNTEGPPPLPAPPPAPLPPQ